MRKIISFLLIVAISVLFITSCSTKGDIEKVVVSDTSYKPIYLYAFKDADVSGFQKGSQTSDDAVPTANGYIYSKAKLSVGDQITVWNNEKFEDAMYVHGTQAVVSAIIKTYPVRVNAGIGKYNISYYDFDASKTYCASKQLELQEVKEYTMIAPKEEVVIVYAG